MVCSARLPEPNSGSQSHRETRERSPPDREGREREGGGIDDGWR